MDAELIAQCTGLLPEQIESKESCREISAGSEVCRALNMLLFEFEMHIFGS